LSLLPTLTSGLLSPGESVALATPKTLVPAASSEQDSPTDSPEFLSLLRASIALQERSTHTPDPTRVVASPGPKRVPGGRASGLREAPHGAHLTNDRAAPDATPIAPRQDPTDPPSSFLGFSNANPPPSSIELPVPETVTTTSQGQPRAGVPRDDLAIAPLAASPTLLVSLPTARAADAWAAHPTDRVPEDHSDPGDATPVSLGPSGAPTTSPVVPESPPVRGASRPDDLGLLTPPPPTLPPSDASPAILGAAPPPRQAPDPLDPASSRTAPPLATLGPETAPRLDHSLALAATPHLRTAAQDAPRTEASDAPQGRPLTPAISGRNAPADATSLASGTAAVPARSIAAPPVRDAELTASDPTAHPAPEPRPDRAVVESAFAPEPASPIAAGEARVSRRGSPTAADAPTASGVIDPTARPAEATSPTMEPLPQATPRPDDSLTPVNRGTVDGVTAPDPPPPTSTLSAVNVAVIHQAAHGDLDLAGYGRVSVSARTRGAGIDVHISTDRTEATALLLPHAVAMEAEVRAANVPLLRLEISGATTPGGSSASAEGKLTPEGGASKDPESHPSRDPKAPPVSGVTPATVAQRARVRIVL